MDHWRGAPPATEMTISLSPSPLAPAAARASSSSSAPIGFDSHRPESPCALRFFPRPHTAGGLLARETAPASTTVLTPVLLCFGSSAGELIVVCRRCIALLAPSEMNVCCQWQCSVDAAVVKIREGLLTDAEMDCSAERLCSAVAKAKFSLKDSVRSFRQKKGEPSHAA